MKIFSALSAAWASSDGRAAVSAAAACFFSCVVLVYCVSVTRSLVLTAAAWLALFSFFSLVSCVISLSITRSASPRYSFGFARAPVLAVFSTTVLAQLASIFLVKESVERLLEDDEHHHPPHTSLFLTGAFFSCGAQLLATYSVRSQPFQHVLTAASTSWLQEQAVDLCKAVCWLFPGLSGLLLPRLNAMSLLAVVTALCCVGDHWLLAELPATDAVATLLLSAAIFGTMFPLSSYTGRILLQTSPPHVLNQLDRCVREASTLDGVLELKSAHFWQLDFSTMAGTVDVRVRRDADEQVFPDLVADELHLQTVLCHVTDKLSSVVNLLTVQVVKDAAVSGGGSWHSLDHLRGSSIASPLAHGHSHDDHGGGHGHSHGGSGGHHGHSHDHGDHHGHSHDAHVTHH